MTPRSRSAAPESQVAWPLRAWFGAEVFFGVASSAALFLSPENSAENFAWPIKPAVVAAVFGGIYFSALITMAWCLATRTWEHVRAVVLPAAVFTAVMLIPTILHLEKFLTQSVPFWIWLASYVLPPPIFVACYVWQQRRSAPPGSAVTAPLPDWARTALLVNGSALVVFAAVVMVAPQLLIAIAPFTMTPLTARAFAGYLSLASLMQISIARENDWPRVRIATSLLLALPVAVGFQLARYASEVAWDNLALWVFLADVAGVAALCAWLWHRSNRTA